MRSLLFTRSLRWGEKDQGWPSLWLRSALTGSQALLLCGLVTGCGGTTTDERVGSGGADEATTASDGDSPGRNAPAENQDSSSNAAGLCERGCRWLDDCCVQSNRCLFPNGCREDCLVTLREAPSRSCLELARSVVECMEGSSCDVLSGEICGSENRAFVDAGCGPAPVDSAGAGDAPAAAPALDPAEAPSAPQPPTDLAGPSFAASVAPIFDEKCTDGCHEPGGILGGPGGIDEVQMDLTREASFASLSQYSTQLPAMQLVGATPEESYLWHKLVGTQEEVGGRGVRMPVVGELTEAELAAVQVWIEGGAAP